MICPRPSFAAYGCWFRQVLRVVAWAFVLYYIAVGLTACKNTHKAAQFSRSKFDVQTDGQMQRGKSSVRGRTKEGWWFFQSKPDRKPK
jgi:uncharacterized membrane protein